MKQNTIILSIISILSAPAIAAPNADTGVLFDNVSNILGPFTRSATGEGLGGVAWLDYDQDDDLDLYLTNGVTAPNALFKNNGNGTFTDVTVSAGVASGSGNSGIVVGDIDNDGYPDIFMSGEGALAGQVSSQTPTKLFHNNGDGTFTDISSTAGVPGVESALSAAMADVNNDGLLDIFIASPGHIPLLFPPGESHSNKLYLNNGNLTFTDITNSAGVTGLYTDVFGHTVTDGACVVGFNDYNHDGWQDIIVGNCNAFWSPVITPVPPIPVRPTPFNLYRNNGDNTFTDVALSVGLDKAGFWMGLAFGDYDNDGNIDFFATSTGTSIGGAYPHALFRNNGNGTFSESMQNSGIPNSEFGWGCTFADFDNNGALDLFQVGSLPLFGIIGPGAGSPGRLFLNDGIGQFQEDLTATGIDLSSKYTSGLAHGDFDGNGFPDIAVMTAPFNVASEDFVLLQNNGNTNHWLTIQAVGTTSNRSAIGALIEVKAGNMRQVREVRAGSSLGSTITPWPTFGLGKKRQAKVTVTWPSGLVETFAGNPADQMITINEGTGTNQHHR